MRLLLCCVSMFPLLLSWRWDQMAKLFVDTPNVIIGQAEKVGKIRSQSPQYWRTSKELPFQTIWLYISSLNSEYNSNFSFLVVWFFRSKSLFHEFLGLTYIILEGVYPRSRSVPHQRNTGNTENITSRFFVTEQKASVLWPSKHRFTQNLTWPISRSTAVGMDGRLRSRHSRHCQKIAQMTCFRHILR